MNALKVGCLNALSAKGFHETGREAAEVACPDRAQAAGEGLKVEKSDLELDEASEKMPV